MGLKIVNFYEMRPKLPFRYKTEWFTGLLSDDTRMSYTVTSITLPTFEISNNEGNSYLGNTIISLPIWNPSNRKLSINFEETDDMLVTQLMDSLYAKSYGKTPWRITIVIHQYNEHYSDEEVKAYVCHLSSYDEPTFQRNGLANAVTCSAVFIVDAVISQWDSSKAVVGGDNNKKAQQGYNTEIKELGVKDQNVEFKFGNLDLGRPEDPFRPKTKATNYYGTNDRRTNETYIRNLMEKEVNGEAKNQKTGTRKEGNYNSLYHNEKDSKTGNPTGLNLGYGTTLSYLERHNYKEGITIQDKKSGETKTFSNLEEFKKWGTQNTSNLEGINSEWVLSDESARKLNDFVFSENSKYFNSQVRSRGLEDVVGLLDENALMGLTHLAYGSPGAFENTLKLIEENKEEVTRVLNENAGFFTTKLVDDLTEKGKRKNMGGLDVKLGDDKKYRRMDYLTGAGRREL